MSVNTIARALAELVEKGFLAIKVERQVNGLRTYARKEEPAVESTSVGFPKELLEQIASIRTTVTSMKDRSSAILNVIAQFLPASIIDSEEPFSFIKPTRPVMQAPPMPSPDSIEALELKLKELLDRGDPRVLNEAYLLKRKILVLQEKAKGLLPSLPDKFTKAGSTFSLKPI